MVFKIDFQYKKPYKEISTGTSLYMMNLYPNIKYLYVSSPVYSFTPSSTITNAYSLYVDAPISHELQIAKNRTLKFNKILCHNIT